MIRFPKGGCVEHRRENAEKRGRLRGQPAHNDGHSRGFSHPEHSQVSSAIVGTLKLTDPILMISIRVC